MFVNGEYLFFLIGENAALDPDRFSRGAALWGCELLADTSPQPFLADLIGQLVLRIRGNSFT